MSFTYELRSTRTVFAPGALTQLPAELDALGVRRAFVVMTPGGGVRWPQINKLLEDRIAGLFDGAMEHVPASVVEAALAQVARTTPDVCVSIGGGSAIGLGKAIARETGLTHAAVPTTYSGSEMTSIWGITDDNGKRTGRDVRAAPRVVVYDPDLTVDLPSSTSAASGMNALAHAVEAMYAASASPAALAMSEESVWLLSGSLRRIATKPDDRQARSDALAGAHLAGLALDITAMGLHHRLCHVLGGTFKLPHATTHAVLLPYVVAFNAPAAPATMDRLARALGASDAVAALFELTRELPVPRSLSELGLRDEDLDRAAREATASPYANPRAATPDDVRELLVRALSGVGPLAIG